MAGKRVKYASQMVKLRMERCGHRDSEEVILAPVQGICSVSEYSTVAVAKVIWSWVSACFNCPLAITMLLAAQDASLTDRVLSARIELTR